jgi:hypothetical protein
MDGV